MPYRPCKHRQSQLGIFQCEKHYFQHSSPEIYDELYSFCTLNVPDRFCPHLDFGFNMEEGPKLYINCTHTYKARSLKSFEDCQECDFPDKESSSLE